MAVFPFSVFLLCVRFGGWIPSSPENALDRRAAPASQPQPKPRPFDQVPVAPFLQPSRCGFRVKRSGFVLALVVQRLPLEVRDVAFNDLADLVEDQPAFDVRLRG